MPTFTEVLAQSLADCSEHVAIHLIQSKHDDLPITYRGLLQGAVGFAQVLARHSIQPGDVVVIILQHGENLIHAFWGAVLHGAVPSILPPLTEKLLPERYRKDLASLIRVTQPAAIVTYPEFEAEVQHAVRQATDLSWEPERAITIERAPAVIVAGEVERAAPDFNTLRGMQRNADDIVLLQHSSGSTGLQKGVALSHRAIFNQLDAYAPAIDLSQDDVIVSWLPLYHDMGLIASFIMPVLRRVPLVLMSPLDWVRAPARLMHAISRYRGTLAWLPNFAYNFCATRIRDRDLEGVNLSSMRAFINCSEPIYDSSHRTFAKRFEPYGLRPDALATCYAMAENVFAVTQSQVGAPPVHTPRISSYGREVANEDRVSSGRLLPNVQLRILDETRNDVAAGAIGEIALKSDCMLTGYYNRPDATDNAFHDGWYLTGDLGFLVDGELFVTGRKKDLIIVGGKNVYPQDLEQLAGEVPGVHAGRVTAFGVFNRDAGTEDVVIIAETETEDGNGGRPQGEDKRERIAEAVRQHITRNSDVAVRQVIIVDARWMIKTSSGKVARSANREKYLQMAEAQNR
jgi:acyl-CoA synthetase (AMP-forming)/AMP-acid ligase II